MGAYGHAMWGTGETEHWPQQLRQDVAHGMEMAEMNDRLQLLYVRNNDV